MQMKPLEHVPHPIASVVCHVDDHNQKYFVHDVSIDGTWYELYGCETLGTDRQIWVGADHHLVRLVAPPSLKRWNKLIEIRREVDYAQEMGWAY